jgi:glycosyltransferase involved in cell wall biosynthesis
MHISKGVIMPSMPFWAWKLVSQAEVVQLHLPQLDAALIAIIAFFMRKPVLLTYHCDLLLPKGFVHGLANFVSNIANHISASLAQVIVTNTQDYAENSPFLKDYLHKVIPILPPVELEPITPDAITALKQKISWQPSQQIIGMVARLATEKGVEFLVQALPEILKRHPEARVVYAGQHENVWGEQAYAAKLAPMIAELGDKWQFLGLISEAEKSALFHLSQVIAVPSLNSTESFSITQVEAMACGAPVVSTDLPGVRHAVQLTGMGRIVPAANADALAEAVIHILDHPESVEGDTRAVMGLFSSDQIAMQYENIFESLLNHER